jgi:hypothetical protein
VPILVNRSWGPGTETFPPKTSVAQISEIPEIHNHNAKAIRPTFRTIPLITWEVSRPIAFSDDPPLDHCDNM